MKFIGITGGVGAGKSKILGYIQKHYKCEIYLADEVAHLVKQPGTECYVKLLGILGEDVAGAEGLIDRQAMAEKIFANPALLGQVNDIIHPAVKKILMERLDAAKSAGEVELFFVEAALLIETGYRSLVDEMWYVYSDEEIRRKRLRKLRGYSDEKISRIMSHQLTEERFRESCDFVIDNSGLFEDSCRQIDKKLEAFTWQE
jgi:dephospho-CoA kinase